MAYDGVFNDPDYHQLRNKRKKMMNASYAQIQMRKGLLEFCILQIISRGEVDASDMLEELTEAKMIIVDGALYPVLNQLKNASLITYEWKATISEPPKKYYNLTMEGIHFLETLSETWNTLVASIQLITSKQ